MDENTNFTRRRMLRGSAGVAAGSVVGSVNMFGEIFGNDDSAEDEIDVNVFVGQELYDDFVEISAYTSSPFEPADIIASYIEHVFGNLVDDMDDISVGVSVIKTPIQNAEFSDSSSDEYREQWKEYINTNLDSDDVANDSNLLLTVDKPNGVVNGTGEIPCSSCSGSNNTAAVVYDVSQSDFYGISETYHKEKISDESSLKPIGTAIHEVGHTVGLEHDDGDVYEDQSEYTIMGSPVDVRNEGFQLMRFSEGIEQSDLQIDVEDESSGLFW